MSIYILFGFKLSRIHKGLERLFFFYREKLKIWVLRVDGVELFERIKYQNALILFSQFLLHSHNITLKVYLLS